jgi:alcohol dehydrogenase
MVAERGVPVRGGVCCLLLAKLAGCEVIASEGTDAKAKLLAELGADRTINYIEKDFMKEIFSMYGKPTRRGGGTDQGVDVVVYYTGGDTWVNSMKTLKVGGRLLTCGATAGFDPKEDLRYIWSFELGGILPATTGSGWRGPGSEEAAAGERKRSLQIQ